MQVFFEEMGIAYLKKSLRNSWETPGIDSRRSSCEISRRISGEIPKEYSARKIDSTFGA